MIRGREIVKVLVEFTLTGVLVLNRGWNRLKRDAIDVECIQRYVRCVTCAWERLLFPGSEESTIADVVETIHDPYEAEWPSCKVQRRFEYAGEVGETSTGADPSRRHRREGTVHPSSSNRL